MAKVTAPLLSFGAQGQIGKAQVYATWKGRAYARQRVIPANPKTAAQTLTRTVFSNANSIWKVGSDLLIAPWNRFADGQVLTGRNAFQGSFVREVRGEVDLAKMVWSPGAKGGLPATALVVTPAALQLTVDITTPTPPAGWTLQAAIAGIIEDQDPSSPITAVTTVTEDLVAPYSIVFAGLVAATTYRVGAWLRWAKPDGSIAYGASLLDSGTTP